METDSVLHLETKQDSSVVLSLVRVHCSSFSSSSIKPPLGGLVCSTTSTTSRGERERGTRGRVGPTRENLVVGERGRDTWFPCPRGPLWNPLKLCIVELFPAPFPPSSPHRHFFVEWWGVRIVAVYALCSQAGNQRVSHPHSWFSFGTAVQQRHTYTHTVSYCLRLRFVTYSHTRYTLVRQNANGGRKVTKRSVALLADALLFLIIKNVADVK